MLPKFFGGGTIKARGTGGTSGVWGFGKLSLKRSFLTAINFFIGKLAFWFNLGSFLDATVLWLICLFFSASTISSSKRFATDFREEEFKFGGGILKGFLLSLINGAKVGIFIRDLGLPEAPTILAGPAGVRGDGEYVGISIRNLGLEVPGTMATAGDLVGGGGSGKVTWSRWPGGGRVNGLHGGGELGDLERDLGLEVPGTAATVGSLIGGAGSGRVTWSRWPGGGRVNRLRGGGELGDLARDLLLGDLECDLILEDLDSDLLRLGNIGDRERDFFLEDLEYDLFLGDLEYDLFLGDLERGLLLELIGGVLDRDLLLIGGGLLRLGGGSELLDELDDDEKVRVLE